MKEQTMGYFWFILSITLNALGNSFMIIANLGSAPWTSAAENLFFVLPGSIGVCVIILHLFSFLVGYLLKVRIPIDVILKSLGLAVAFGLFIDMFLYFHELLFVPESLFTRFIYLFIGLNLIALAVSIYFQSSSIYLPTDFLLKAFGSIFKNYTLGTIVWTAIPLSIGLIIVISRWELVGIGIGTILFMFVSGMMIDFYSRWIVIQKAPNHVLQEEKQ